MTITTTKRKAGPYHGDGMNVLFPFDFRVFEAQDLCVTYADESGAEHVLSLNTDYKVNLNIDQETMPGGNVILNQALQHGRTITLTSGMAYLQPTKLTNHGGFYPTVINDALDRLTIFVQQLEEQVERSVKVTVSSENSPDELVASINESASVAKQSAETAQASESNSKQNAEVAQTAADALTHGLQDLAGVKTGVDHLQEAIVPATVAEIQSGKAGKLVDAAGLKLYGRTVGEIGTFCFATPPTGWLLANGDAVSRTTYARLFAAIGETFGAGDGSTTFNLPDLRGEFIRGADLGRGVDTDRALGSIQGDAIRNITGSFGVYSNYGGNIDNGACFTHVQGSRYQISGASGAQSYNYIIFDASRVVPTAGENRPRNIALAMYIFAGA